MPSSLWSSEEIEALKDAVAAEPNPGQLVYARIAANLNRRGFARDKKQCRCGLEGGSITAAFGHNIIQVATCQGNQKEICIVGAYVFQ